MYGFRIVWGISLLAALCMLTGCVGGSGARRGAAWTAHGERLTVRRVKNLSGVPLKLPALYMGDAVGRAGGLAIKKIDLALVTEAAVYERLSELGHSVQWAEGATETSFEVLTAVTGFRAGRLRQTGRFELSMTLMVVDSRSRKVIRRGDARREFQLFDTPPAEAGAIGDQRDIEDRVLRFTASLVHELLDDAGL